MVRQESSDSQPPVEQISSTDEGQLKREAGIQQLAQCDASEPEFEDSTSEWHIISIDTIAVDMNADFWMSCHDGDLATARLLLELGADCNTEMHYFNSEDDQASTFDCDCVYCRLRRPPSPDRSNSTRQSMSLISEQDSEPGKDNDGESHDDAHDGVELSMPDSASARGTTQARGTNASGTEDGSDSDEASGKENDRSSTNASAPNISSSSRSSSGTSSIADDDGCDNVANASALYVAIDRDHFDVAELLLELTDLRLKTRYTKERRTCFYQALRKSAKSSFLQRFLALYNAPSFIDTPDHSGRTPLHWAAAQGFVDIVGLLLRRGANVDAQDNEGNSPLSTVILLGPSRAVHVARSLLIHGADINLQDHKGNTALHQAASYSGLVGAKLLLAWGARIDITNNLEKTALQCVPPHWKGMKALLTPENASKIKREVRDAWSPPQVSQEITTCREFEIGTVFCLKSRDGPSEPQLWNQTAFEVIYREARGGNTFHECREDQYLSILKGRGYNDVSGRDFWKWIHIPSNNLTWIRDLLGTICHSHQGRDTVEEYWHMMNFFDKHNVPTSGASCQRKPHVSADFRGVSSNDPKWLSLVIPFVDFESEHYLHRGDSSCESEQCAKMTRLHSEHPNFNGLSGIPHPQTLDQSYYDGLKDSDLADRDRDQVVYKWFSKMESDEPKLLMVNQLWLWKVDESTIITAFPERWHDGPEHTLLQDVRHSDTPPEVWKSPDAFIDYILSVCITIPREFDDARFGFHILEVFESWIGNLSSQESVLSRELRDFLEERAAAKTNKPDADHATTTTTDAHLSISEEFKLIYELRDVLDELFILRKLCITQKDLAEQYLLVSSRQLFMPGTARDGTSPSTSSPSPRQPRLEHAVKEVKRFIDHIQRLEENATRILDNLDQLVQVKQAQSSLNESRLASEQAVRSVNEAERSRQLNAYIMLFTVVTVVFTPLSFMAGLFALSIEAFPRNNEGEPRYTSSWITGRMFAGEIISLVLIVTTFLLLLWSRKRRRQQALLHDVDVVEADMKMSGAGGLAVEEEKNKKSRLPDWKKLSGKVDMRGWESGIGSRLKTRRRRKTESGDVEKQGGGDGAVEGEGKD